MGESPINRSAWNLMARPVRGMAYSALAMAGLSLMFLSVAIWNGFPLTFYDTGGYLLEGLAHTFVAERAPVYADLLFLAGARVSLWPVVILQALMISYMILQVARAEVPGLSLRGFTAIGAVLSLFTGIAWYAGQVEPDIFTPVVILGGYLLLLRSDRLGRAGLVVVTGLTGLAVATHPSHLGLMGGLWIGAFVLRLAAGWKRYLPRPDLRYGAIAWTAALSLVLGANFALTGKLFINKSGSIFVLARLMQDGIVQRLLRDTCPPNGDIHWRLCAYQDKVPQSAEAWLWGETSSFRALGGFTSPAQQDEGRRMVMESLKRYPLLHVRKAVRESVLQFFQFKTGDGIEPQLRTLEPQFKQLIPAQMPAYLAARQQHARFRYKPLNLIHVPVAAMSILGVAALLRHAVGRRRWGEGLLPALVLLGLVGNAIICGTFSNPHDRYQSRVIWLPTLVVLLAVARNRRALQPLRRRPEVDPTIR
jgi:hypothetical protein